MIRFITYSIKPYDSDDYDRLYVSRRQEYVKLVEGK